MTIDELHEEMINRFERADGRIDRTDARIDELHEEMINRFERTDGRIDKTDARIDELRAEMIVRFETVDGGFGRLRAEMKAEHETTRRHFEVWAEKMSDSVKIVAEATAHHAVRIDGHENRLKRLERPRRS